MNTTLRGEGEVTAAERQQDRFETEHVILYNDRGILAADDARRFVDQLERGFVAVSGFLGLVSNRS